MFALGHVAPLDAALARVKNWIANETLTSTDLNAEFNNLINNALSLISPLTGNLAAGGNDITGLDELALNDAAANPSSAGRLRRNGATLLVHGRFGAEGTAPVLSVCGSGPSPTISGTDQAASVVTGGGATACTVTFNTAWTAIPVCLLLNLSDAVVPGYSISTTVLLVTIGASKNFQYVCMGKTSS